MITAFNILGVVLGVAGIAYMIYSLCRPEKF
ncbi:potassium-transporting ATPase subunit F [Bifidobacterium catulorum]|uniref:Potassium-transporting ATPase subunit F n=1 Tax=Bifidobacterium catulorum TaxID=1630173 RepID=A0A2U2MT42_9BIFI|nr:potassium-transporting ATPase subunit F [Bifidobacterium catulorum]